MNDVIFDLAISTILTVIKLAKTSDPTKRKLKRVFLKVATKIFEVYGDEPEFKEINKAPVTPV